MLFSYFTDKRAEAQRDLIIYNLFEVKQMVS